MTTLFTTAAFRALIALAICLGVTMAPITGAMGCGAGPVPAKCKCCKDPQAGCCAANQHQPEKPAPVAPVNTTNLRDVAPVAVAMIAVLPPVMPRDFPIVSGGAPARAPHVARHSLLCIRTV